MSVSGVGATTTTIGKYEDVLAEQSNLDQTDFMQLLITELTNQDPLEPMSSSEMTSQMSQYSSLEELAKINTNLQAMLTGQTLVDGATMIGKAVYGINSTTGDHLVGTVAGVLVEDGEARLVLAEGGWLAVKDVLQVAEQVTDTTDTTDTSDTSETAETSDTETGGT